MSQSPGRRDQRLEERRQRQAELRRHMDAEQRRTKLLRIGGAFVAVAVLAGVGGWVLTHQPPAVGRSVSAGPGGQHVPDGSPITYASYPPTSGPHYPAPASWGTYDSPLEEGRFVHNLEHGGIAILYKCPPDASACSGLKQQLQDIYKQLPPESQFHEVKAVVSPYDKLNHQVAVLAWGWIDELDQVSPDEIVRFYQAHVDRGPEAVG